MRMILSIILAIIILFFFGCKTYTRNHDSLKEINPNIYCQEYEIHARNEVTHIDSLGIWECFMESNMNPSCRFYFDNGKLKKWGH
jgi:hypothetical protein